MDEEKILAKIDALHKAFEDFRLAMSIDVALIKQKNGTSARMWGLFGGALPVLIGLGIWFMRSR